MKASMRLLISDQ